MIKFVPAPIIFLQLTQSIRMESTQRTNWSHNLLESMKNPEMIVIKSDCAVVIKDKYPKAKYHFLVLPWENIPSIYHLNEKHVALLVEIELLAKNAIELTGLKETNFRIGYHAVPSMQRLHLHVISNDFISQCLKTKKHWNSFTTEFFLPVDDVHNELRRSGAVKKIPEHILKEWMSSDLKCHRCNYKAKNMPSLKNHLENLCVE